jgi:LysM repeat protein
VSQEFCSEFAPKNGITVAQLYAWNPILGANGEACETQFQADMYYCVGAPSSTPTTPTPTSNPSTTATPSPVQSGINPQCTKYVKAVSQEFCSEFAPKNGITVDQLYAWNPILGANGEACNKQFQADMYYCVGAPSATIPTTSTASRTMSVSAPGPTQSGITSSCNKFAQVTDNDTGCESFASHHGITPTQLYTWNTMLGAGGANCGTQLWAGNYYCIGVSS